MRPTLSICIPSYQRARLLGPLLRELDAPDFLPFLIGADGMKPALIDRGISPALACHWPTLQAVFR